MSYGIHTLQNMFAPLSSVQAGLKDGRWVAAVCEPYDSPRWRLRGALAVLAGNARAELRCFDGLPTTTDLARVINPTAFDPPNNWTLGNVKAEQKLAADKAGEILAYLRGSAHLSNQGEKE